MRRPPKHSEWPSPWETRLLSWPRIAGRRRGSATRRRDRTGAIRGGIARRCRSRGHLRPAQAASFRPDPPRTLWQQLTGLLTPRPKSVQLTPQEWVQVDQRVQLSLRDTKVRLTYTRQGSSNEAQLLPVEGARPKSYPSPPISRDPSLPPILSQPPRPPPVGTRPIAACD